MLVKARIRPGSSFLWSLRLLSCVLLYAWQMYLRKSTIIIILWSELISVHIRVGSGRLILISALMLRDLLAWHWLALEWSARFPWLVRFRSCVYILMVPMQIEFWVVIVKAIAQKSRIPTSWFGEHLVILTLRHIHSCLFSWVAFKEIS